VVLFVLVMQHVGGWSAGIAELSKLKLMGKIPGNALLELGGFGPPPIMKAGMLTQFTLSLAFAICAANLGLPHLIIRFYAAKNVAVIRKGMIITPIIIGIFVFTVYSTGPFAWLIIPKYVPPEALAQFLRDPDMVIPFLIQKLLPVGLNAFLLVAIVAAGQSTISSVIMVLVSALSRDIIQVAKPKIDEKRLLTFTRWATVLLGFVPFLLAIRPPGIVVMIVGLAFSVIGSAFTAPLLIGLYWRGGTAQGAWMSMILSTITCIWWTLTYYQTLWIYPIIPGLIVGIVSFVVISWFTKKPSGAILEMIRAGS
jgi:Na+/pantothenate symporter